MKFRQTISAQPETPYFIAMLRPQTANPKFAAIATLCETKADEAP